MAKETQDHTGNRFGRLVAVQLLPKDSANRKWLCECDCGETTVVLAHNLRAGKVKSCGCLLTERVERTYQNGYAFVTAPNHPRANPNSGRVREHIIVMEQVLGRLLERGEEVHHINGVRDDNRPENLELWTKSHPSGARVEDVIKYVVAHHRDAVLEALKIGAVR